MYRIDVPGQADEVVVGVARVGRGAPEDLLLLSCYCYMNVHIYIYIYIYI